MNSEGVSRKEPGATIQYFCDIYLAFFDETRGHEVLLTYPDEDRKCDEECMRPIHIHSIWFLSEEEQSSLDHVDLDYGGRTYFAKKFGARSKRKKTRAGIADSADEVMVLFVSLPEELNIFGSRILKGLFEAIQQTIKDELSDLIIGHIAKKKIIQSPKTRQEIQRGNEVAQKFIRLCDWVLASFTPDLLQGYMNTVKKQKALAYLLLQDQSLAKNRPNPVSDITYEDIFEPMKEHTIAEKVDPRRCVSIVELDLVEGMIELTLRNNSGTDLEGFKVTVSHVQEFFERVYFEQDIDIWFEDEEILVQFPVIETINDYIIIVEGKFRGEVLKCVNKKFSLKELKKGKIKL
ncbi:MAG: hypothetical protein ACTSU5_12020 [Promethearchaeota archaeon]